ncbi:hypothetical protein ACVHNB_21125 [Streptomyces sp. YJ-C3]
MSAPDKDTLVRDFVDTFRAQVADALALFLTDDVVIAEQIHGLALPGKKLAPVMNMAVYELRDGRIAAWRDYTNPAYASALLQA